MNALERLEAWLRKDTANEIELDTNTGGFRAWCWHANGSSWRTAPTLAEAIEQALEKAEAL